jgi:two-component system sensor histidine kinase DesK
VVLFAAASPGLAVFFGNRSFREMQLRRAMLRLSQEEVRRLSERAERERIARDLHDLLGHSLSLIALKAELARKLALRAPERAADEMAQVEQLARSSLEEVRMALHDMRRATIDHELAQVRLCMESAGVALRLECADVLLDRDCEAALAFALREASTNIIRHARASEALIRINEDRDFVTLEVCDNGRGGLPELDLRASSHGLRGMRERVEACGGQLRLSSTRGVGTQLWVQVPRAQSGEQTSKLTGSTPAAWQPVESLR